MIEFLKGFVYDVAEDALNVLEVVHELMPGDVRDWLEGPIEFGMQRLLDVMDLAGPN